MPGADVPQNVDAAAVGHVDVEDHQVPLAVAQLLQRLRSGGGLSDRIDGTVLLQVVAQPRTDHRVIVGNKNARHLASKCAAPPPG